MEIGGGATRFHDRNGRHSLYILEFSLNDFESPAYRFQMILERLKQLQGDPGIHIPIYCRLGDWDNKEEWIRTGLPSF